MEPVLLLPLAAFIALAAASVIILRRAGRLIANQRAIQTFRTAVRDLDARIGMSLDGAAQRIDGVRRQQLSAEGLGDTVAATGDAITRYSDEARALRGPPEAAAIARDIVSELGAGLIGGPGMAPGGHLGTEFAVFEATHGTAPEFGRAACRARR